MSAASAGLISLLGLDPATYQPHALHAPGPRRTSRPTATRTSSSSCCTPAGTSRWRCWAARCGSTSRATSGPSSSRRPRTSKRSSGSTSTRCSPTARCPTRSPSRSSEDARSSSSSTPGTCPTPRRRAIAASTSRARSSPRRSTSRASACATSTGRATSSSGARTTAASSGSGGLLRRRAAAVHRARALRRRTAPAGGGAARPAARELLRRALATTPRANPFARFGAQLAPRSAAAARGRRATLPRYAFATVRMVGSAFEVGASHVEWLLGEEGGARRRGDATNRRRLQDALLQACAPARRSTRPRRSRRWRGHGRRASRSWTMSSPDSRARLR